MNVRGQGGKRRGAVLAFVAVGLLTMLAMFALVVDAGLLYTERSRLQTAVDAGALAGVSLLPGTVNHPSATSRAKWYVRQNDSNVLDANITVTFGDSVSGTATITDGRINVTATRDVSMVFAKLIGFPTVPVSATASAGLQYFGGGVGIVPFGISEASVNNLSPGSLFVLKYGPQALTAAELASLNLPVNTLHGNFGALALGGSGANNYSDNIKFGSSVKVSVGDTISTEPGVMSGPTDKAVEYRVGLDQNVTYLTVQDGSARIIVLPIIDPGIGDISGRTNVTVKGFAAFFLEDFTGQGTNGYVTGRFREKLTITGSGGGSPSGVYVASLVN